MAGGPPRWRRFLKAMARARAYRSRLAQIVDLLWHKLRINTNPADYYRFGFFRRRGKWEEKSRYVGLHGSRYWPYENNRRKYEILFTDKLIQKVLLQGLGLPTPALLATVGSDYELKSPAALHEWLARSGQEVVVKPISGTGGKGIFFSPGAEEAETIWRVAERHGGCLIEKRVANTADIATLHPSSLNTFRVITIKTSDGAWHVAAAFLKVGCGGANADNAAQGGIQVTLDESGRVSGAYDFRSASHLTHHPDSGLPLKGARIRGREEAVSLGLAASRKLGFMGTLGWDIAMTGQGAQIIEGNTLWGVIDQVTLGGLITDEMKAGLRQHHLFSRWDRSRMYPGCDRPRRKGWRG